MIEIYCDGGCKPKNNKCINSHGTYGFIVFENNTEIYKEGKYIGNYSSNNIAEYTAVLKASEYINENNLTDEITIYTDSKLVYSQLNNKWKSNDENLLEYKKQIISNFQNRNVVVIWIPRDRNIADSLTRIKYEV